MRRHRTGDGLQLSAGTRREIFFSWDVNLRPLLLARLMQLGLRVPSLRRRQLQFQLPFEFGFQLQHRQPAPSQSCLVPCPVLFLRQWADGFSSGHM